MAQSELKLERALQHLRSFAERQMAELQRNASRHGDASLQGQALLQLSFEWMAVSYPLYTAKEIAALPKSFALTAPVVARDYNALDFGDFLEFATSPIAPAFDPSNFPDRTLTFYDALPGTFEEPEFELVDPPWGISLAGAAVARSGRRFHVMMMFRDFEEEEWRTSGSDRVFSHIAPYPFFYTVLNLDLEEDGKTLTEEKRHLLIAHNDKVRGPEYQIYTSSLSNTLAQHALKQSLGSVDRLLVEHAEHQHATATQRQFAMCFELARLTLLLPDYYRFMYDLVVARRERVGTRPVSGGPGKTKTGRAAKVKHVPVYKLVKSIRVTYVEEERIRRQQSTGARSWKAPAVKFRVQGHWRELPEPWHKGHGPDGSEALGKTWVREYVKGRDKGQYEVVERDPRVVIKIKQPLSYARDVIAAHDVSSSKVLKIRAETTQLAGATGDGSLAPSGAKPSAEWMYEERRKLTAGLRYIVLKRDYFTCQLCGAQAVRDGVRLEVDHIVPIAEWGRTVQENLRTSCSVCNRGKGANI